MNYLHSMRAIVTWILVTLAVAFGVVSVGLAATTSPLQDWYGNTTEADDGHVLVVCFSLVVSMGLSSLAGVLLWLRRERSGVPSMTLVILALLLITSLLLGGLKWFKWYQG